MIVFGVHLPHSDVFHYQLERRSADGLHGHDEVHQLSLPLIGAPTMVLDTVKRELTDNRRVITSPGHRHENFAGDAPVRLLVMNISRTLVDQVYSESTGHEAQVEFASWCLGSSEALRRHGESMLRRFAQSPGEFMETEQWEWDFARMLLTLHHGSHADRWRSIVPAPDHPALRRAITRMHDEIGSELALDDLAQSAELSKAHLIRLFQVNLGKSPVQYLTELRIKRAEELLVRTDQAVTEIAFASGFGSLSTFERVFKQRHGVSARMYRLNRR